MKPLILFTQLGFIIKQLSYVNKFIFYCCLCKDFMPASNVLQIKFYVLRHISMQHISNNLVFTSVCVCVCV